MPKSQEQLDREIRETLRKRQEAERARVREARATSGKELFNIEKFREHYNVSLDHGNLPLTQDLIEDYERQYYLSATGVKTLREFADYLHNLRNNDAT
ncbi:MAG TPA: hypothetical protein VE153_12985 [Myxococcus sp.]|nr:hypothetical protein [Myxococcus sp.]